MTLEEQWKEGYRQGYYSSTGKLAKESDVKKAWEGVKDSFKDKKPDSQDPGWIITRNNT